MFGVYHSMKSFKSDKDVSNLLSFYNNKLDYPLEGVLLTPEFQKEYQSLTYSEQRISDVPGFLSMLDANNLTVIQLMKSGVPMFDKEAPYTKFVLDNDIMLHEVDYDEPILKPVIGQDQQGDVVYVDFSHHNESTELLGMMLKDFEERYHQQRYIVLLKHNEITNMYCTGDCIFDHEDFMDKLLFKPGNNAQIKNSIPFKAQRVIGGELNTRNQNGLLQQIAFSNTLSGKRMPLFSSSTAMGSG